MRILLHDRGLTMLKLENCIITEIPEVLEV